MRLRYFLLLQFLLVFMTTGALRSQSFLLYDLDASNYPDMSAKLIALEEDGRPIQDFTADDLVITENGDTVDGVVIECPPATQALPVSAVLVTDRSGSMNLQTGFSASRLDLAKSGSSDFVRMLSFIPPTAVAITAFDNLPAIISDFRTTADPLVNAINSLAARGGTEYTAAFTDPMVGGIALLASRPDSVRRVLVFLTDGEPTHRPETDAIIALAQQHSVEVYAVTIAMPMNNDLRLIAEATGGAHFENVSTTDAIRAIYRVIALGSQGISACRIRWRAPLGCVGQRRRDVAVTLVPRGLTARASYTAPLENSRRLALTPSTLWFGSVASPATKDLQVSMTARNGDFEVTSSTIGAGQPFSIVDWGGTPPPFVLRDGASRIVTLRFAPPDSALYATTLQLETLPCPVLPITVTGGVRRTTAPGTIYLLSPQGGEAFGGCDSVLIRWGGVAPTDTVLLEYSDDNGHTWKTIAAKATGLSYTWKPPVPGTRYRLRISARGDGQNIITTVAGGGFDPDAPEALKVYLSAPAGVAVQGDILYFSEAGEHIIRRVDLVTGSIRTIAGTGSPGNLDASPATIGRLNGPQGLAISGDTLYIADYDNHRIRRLILSTSTLETIAGTGQSDFSGDGGPAIEAHLQYPSYLALRGAELYVSDAGNNRVRKINLETSIISTVAGGGTIFPGGEGQGTAVMLNRPQGLAIGGNMLYIAEQGTYRIRRLDLSNGQLRTFAGFGIKGVGGDTVPAIEALFRSPADLAIAGNTLFVSDSGTHRVRQIDIGTGIITGLAGDRGGSSGFSGDGGPAHAALLDRPTGITVAGDVLYVADLVNGRVRAVTLGRMDGSDSTQNAFSVAVARLAVADGIASGVGMGSLAVGAARDTVIVAAVCNSGNLPLLIDSIRIIGANAGDFALVSGASAVAVSPGGCRDIEFRFAPTAIGERTAQAVIITECAGRDTIVLRGTGRTPCGITALDRLNFGTIEVGADRDTIIQQTICNTGSEVLQGTVTLRSEDGSFSIVAGGGPFSLTRGDCHQVTLRFSPKTDGRTTAVIDYGTPGICEPVATLLIGQGVSDALVVEAPTFPVLRCEGDQHDSIVVLRNAGTSPIEITGAVLSQNNEGFSLTGSVPSTSAPVIMQPGDQDTLRVRFAPASAGSKSAVLTVSSNAGDVVVTLAGRRDSIRVAAVSDLLLFTSTSGAFPRDTFIVIENTGSVAMQLSEPDVLGPDAARFLLFPDQFPVTIPAGGRVTIRLRATGPASSRSLRAQLQFSVDPTCDSTTRMIELVIPGDSPELSAAPVVFTPLVCEDDQLHDSVVAVHNIGGGVLTIDDQRIEGDAEGNFIFTGSLPISIQPGESAVLSVRFVPKTPGAKSATLVLESNSVTGDVRVALTGRRDQVMFAATEDTLLFQAALPGTSDTRSITITNTGTAPLSWTIPPAAGAFTVVSITPPTTLPGGTSTVTIRFDAGADGYYSDSLSIQESRCGAAWLLALQGIVGDAMRATAYLPVDSAFPGEEVMLPIRLVPADRDAFAAAGARTFTTTIRFHGLLLVPESVTQGTITNRSFDPATKVQTVTISGDYSRRTGDTLLWFVAAAVLGDRPTTPLEFVSFTWDAPGVLTDTVNGAFTVIGDCSDVRLRTVAAPKIIAVTPQPVHREGSIEIELEEWNQLRATLVDAQGREIAVINDSVLDAGRHRLTVSTERLQSGVYSVVLVTPYAQISRQIVIVK